MTQHFKLVNKQKDAISLIGSGPTHILLKGGSRSTKTFTHLRTIAYRAINVEASRHAVLRFRFNHVKSSVVFDTFPKMMALCGPDWIKEGKPIDYHIDKSQWFAEFGNGSQIWFGGLDDKERTEKILGQEYSTIFLNEISQIPWSSRNMALTRLAQKCLYKDDDMEKHLRLLMLYDCNPPSQAHWSYKVFEKKTDPDTGKPLPDPENYASLLMNPSDNEENLPDEYLRSLQNMPKRYKDRFYYGKYADITENALWTEEIIDKWRSTDIDLPDMQRVIVAVDPSGADDDENKNNDDIGISVAGLGADGNGYLLEDLTIKAGPAKWGNVATSAYERHDADRVVGEDNFGGAMVKYVIQTQRPNTPYKAVKASRGKVVRAEPISALHELGKIRFAGYFPELEEELLSFTTAGYLGERSPNRADAMIWAFTELFPGMTKEEKKQKPMRIRERYRGEGAWMA